MSAKDSEKAFSRVRLFLASPSDLHEERDRLLQVVQDLNHPNGFLESLGLHLQVLDWRTHVAPNMGRPEDAVLEQFPVESWDIFVGMMWLRFGSPTGAVNSETGLTYDSGTYEEFMLAHRSWQKNARPRLLFYRCIRAPKDVFEIDLAQLQKVKDFFAQFAPDGQHPGFSPTFEQPDDFARRVRRDLENVLLALAKGHGRQALGSAIAARPLDHDNDVQLYLQKAAAAHRNLPVAGFETNLRIPIPLDQVYITLRANMSELARAQKAGGASKQSESSVQMQAVTVQEALQFARLRNYDGLVILGAPGAGKTTLTKYFLLCFASGTAREKLGWPEPLLPLLLFLREVDPAKSLIDNLLMMLEKYALPLPQQTLRAVLDAGQVLLLLDGLDEVPTDARRAAISRWIHTQAHQAFPLCPLLVTSRFSGYRGDAVLPGAYLRLEILDFEPAQIKQFLENWLISVETHLHEDSDFWRTRARQQAEDLFNRVIQTPALLELAINPLMLQIIALVHRDRGTLPERRVELYQECTDVLLERWDKAKGMEVPLTAAQARQLLQPLALWMHSVENRREVRKQEILKFLKPVLPRIKPEANADNLLSSWRERSGIFKGEGNTFFFQHLSFQEYLTAEEIRNRRQVQILVRNFNKTWWREPTLLAMGLTNPPIFEEFMSALLRSQTGNGGAADFMLRCLEEALVKEEAPFVQALKKLRRFAPRYWAVLALDRIGTETALAAVRTVLRDNNERLAALARNVLERSGKPPAAVPVAKKRVRAAGKLHKVPSRLVNPVEQNAEYVLIPGGKYRPSFRRKVVTVPALYFARYPVTNRLYRRFIDYLAGKASEGILKALPLKQFGQSLLAFAAQVEKENYVDYLGEDLKKWPTLLRSEQYRDRRFNGADQPVVGVTWYAAMAYCHWLTELQGASGKGEKATVTYRLPTEEEWEWAAGGGQRKYPWGSEEPDEKRANYDQKVGQTTPVGAYPKGATPEGLMDMAGNVWEWMGNKYAPSSDARALRGGAWYSNPEVLRCVARDRSNPVNPWRGNGFRVVCAQSAFDTLTL
ncbi:MAG: Hercynine oxygenase [bacterium]|nr:Hercynine oxygenase [bacterium]